MKLMFYITSIEIGGGAERVLANLANRFSIDGNECILVTSEDSRKKYPLENKVRYIPLGKTRINGFLKRNITLFRKLRNLVLNEKPDVLVSFMAEPNFRAIPACMGTNTKVLISVRNDPDREYPTILHRMLAKSLFKKADFTVFQTKDAAKWFSEKIRAKSAIIYNQVDDAFFNATATGRKPENIVATGRLEPQKNHKMLIDAFIKTADCTDEKLLIYGDGSLKEALQRQIDNAGMTGRILLKGKTDDVAGAIRNARIYVLSSDFEGMPNALMEAMAMGLACISTDCPCGGPHELIEDGKSGILVPVNDSQAMANAIKRLLPDRELAGKLAKGASARAADFRADKVFARWNSIVSDLASQ